MGVKILEIKEAIPGLNQVSLFIQLICNPTFLL